MPVTEIRRPGRPALGENVRRVPLYASDEDARRLEELAGRWGLTKSAALRKAIQLAAEQGRGADETVARYLKENTVITEDGCKRHARGILRALGL